MAEPVSPLDVLLHTMRMFLDLENWKAAADVAKAAAPYVHARARHFQAPDDLANIEDDQLADLCALGRVGTETASGYTKQPGTLDKIRSTQPIHASGTTSHRDAQCVGEAEPRGH